MTFKMFQQIIRRVFVIVFLYFILSNCFGFSNGILREKLSDEKTQIVERVIFDTFGQKGSSFEFLSKGRSDSMLVKVKIDRKFYVIRILEKNRSQNLYTSLENEISCMVSASRKNIAPKIYYYNVKEGLIIMDYIEPDPLTGFVKKSSLENIADKLRLLHTSEDFQITTDIFEDIDIVSSLIKEEDMPLLAREALWQARKLKSVISKYKVIRPSHKELNYNNIICKDSKCFFIDWETAGNANPYIDLAVIGIFLLHDVDDEIAFLRYYFQSEPTPKQIAQFYLMRQCVLCWYGFKILRRIPVNEENKLSDEYIRSLPEYREFMKGKIDGKIKRGNQKNFRDLAYIMFREIVRNSQTRGYEMFKEILSSKPISFLFDPFSPICLSVNGQPLEKDFCGIE